ncbi:MAG: hypothetical protein ABIP39_06485 [Polyangiaceae bacterium]
MHVPLAVAGGSHTYLGCVRSAGTARCGMLLMLLLSLSSCGANLSVLHPTSHVTCTWSIARRADAESCSKVRSSNVHVDVYLAGNDTGLFDRSFDAPCTDFTTTLELVPGGYYAFATLEDGDHQPRAIVTRIHPFNARADTEITVTVDFPKGAILP